jgi:DNA processing protein
VAEPKNQSSLFHWLALERVPGIGPLSIARLIKAFGSPEKALQASREKIRQAGLTQRAAENIASSNVANEKILKDIETLRDIGAHVITRWDPNYPENLQEIYDPPALLFVRGEFSAQDVNAVAVVGTRNPTHYGVEITQAITRDLVRAGITIVSGLARGIDTAAHWAALRDGGRTIGVLGCGIDVCYPKENKELVDHMAQNGAVISEFRPSISPLATNFYRRNRIVSGLSRGTLVVEAAPRSGSLITAAHAIDQNREVFALPGSVLNKRSWGPHHLLKEGAALVESAEDIISALFGPANKTALSMHRQMELEELRDLSETGKAVFEAIDLDPVHIDSLCETLGIDAGRLSGVLLELELQGLIRQHPGKMFSRMAS